MSDLTKKFAGATIASNSFALVEGEGNQVSVHRTAGFGAKDLGITFDRSEPAPTTGNTFNM